MVGTVVARGVAHRLVFGLPQRVIARIPDSLTLSGRTLTQLIPIVWRNYARAEFETGTEAASAEHADVERHPLKEVSLSLSLFVCCMCYVCVVHLLPHRVSLCKG
jgi:hypothetical protein